jgi:hypothetical protein
MNRIDEIHPTIWIYKHLPFRPVRSGLRIPGSGTGVEERAADSEGWT